MRFTPANTAASQYPSSAPPYPSGVPQGQPAAPQVGIPLQFNQIWLGGQPFPERWAHYTERLRALHPAWGYRLWTNDDLPDLWECDPFLASLGLASLFDVWQNFGFQSDIVRLAILWKHGGVYLDTDCEVFHPLDTLAFGCDAFCGATFPGETFSTVLVQNAVLAACPQHPWMTLCLTRLKEGLQDAAKDTPAGAAAKAQVKSHLMNILDLTGPGMLSSALTEYRARPESIASDVRIVPARFLFPAVPSEPQSPTTYPSALLLHRWDGSWVRE